MQLDYLKNRSARAKQSGREAHGEHAQAGASNSWLSSMLGLNDVEQDEDITSLDLIYEQLAHRIVYQSGLHPEDQTLLTAWGYQPTCERLEGTDGLHAALFMPADGSDKVPVVVFRGTEPTQKEDLCADLDPVIGQGQFEANRAEIGALFSKAGSCDVTGHSLGAALAQLAAMEFSGIRQVIGFQAPAISAKQAKEFSERSNKPDVRYHLAQQDMVDLGGEQHLDGEFFVHNARNLNNVLDAHTGYLLLSPQYDALRSELGLTNDMLSTLDQRNESMFGVAHNTDKLTEQHEALRYDQYPRQDEQAVIESIRQTVGGGLSRFK